MPAITPVFVKDIIVDRSIPKSLTHQITENLRNAILDGRLEAGSRLPSWLDMATQLGVARGTVKAAYETLADEALVFSAGAAGTRVAKSRPQPKSSARILIERPLQELERGFDLAPLPFQMGVPAQDAFPAKLWSRVRMRAVREEALGPGGPPDPRGHPMLRAQIASYLSIARGIRCHPDQIIVTSGYRNGLSVALMTLQCHGRTGWVEDPGYPLARMALELCGMRALPVPVDVDGIDVSKGISLAPNAAVAIVTPGQHAPSGVTMSTTRRRQLLDWAVREDAWIIEDDYLSELQLYGRARIALAAEDDRGRVIHVGTFSKTLSPTLGLGFVVAPIELAKRFGEVAGCLNPATNSTTQLALAEFLADGHYLRHLRHMKTLYRERRDALHRNLGVGFGYDAMAGLAVLTRLPAGTDDVALCKLALESGINPAPLSPWHTREASGHAGLLLGVTNLDPANLHTACAKLKSLIDEEIGPIPTRTH